MESTQAIFTMTIQPLPLPLPNEKSIHFPIQKAKVVPKSYELYSGNFTASLKTTISLKTMIPKFVEAVKMKRIDGARYFNATTREQVSAGKCSTIKKKTFTTKRRRIDFDHQISIFWKKGFHVKVFKTGKLLIPACGSEAGARTAFREIAAICGTSLMENSFTCNNQNIRFILDNDIDGKSLFKYLSENHFLPERTKTNRIKCKVWWNTQYNTNGKCSCIPTLCSKIQKREKGFEQAFGKCTPSTIMFGKKSWTVFGTTFQKQRDDITKWLATMEKVINEKKD